MGKHTEIQWTDATWNPWHGCHKVSEGCKFCYMYRGKEQHGQEPDVVLRSLRNFSAPLGWKEPNLVFTCSWSDWFVEEADEWRPEAWDIIKCCPHLTFQILTKRPERILDHLPPDWGAGYPNVWLGVSAENQERWNERVALLMEVPAVIHWVSAEPLLGPINPTAYCPECKKMLGSMSPTCGTCFSPTRAPGWVIVGGESGNDTGKWRYRPAEQEWFLRLLTKLGVYSSRRTGPKVFVKQMGTAWAKSQGFPGRGLKDEHGNLKYSHSKVRAGGIPEYWLSHLQIQEMPVSTSGLFLLPS